MKKREENFAIIAKELQQKLAKPCSNSQVCVVLKIFIYKLLIARKAAGIFNETFFKKSFQ